MKISRRTFLGSALLSLMFFKFETHSKVNKQMNMTKPKPLKEGDLVGIIAPGTAVPNPDELQKAIEILNLLGLRYIFSRNIIQGSNYKSRSVSERVEDLMQVFTNPEVKAVFCIRGGYGSGQLLDQIDYSQIRKNPKIFVGYSDITALHIALNRFANLVTFHGPVLLSPFTEYSFQNLKQILFGKTTIPIVKNPENKSGVRESHPIRTIKGGQAEGVVIGGNLSIISSLIGTPFEFNFSNSILLLEDVGEEPYRIDRMLNQLRLAGKLEQANGIIFGECNDCNPSDSQVWDFSLGEVLDFYFKSLNKPTFYGLTFGHTSNQATIPLGLKAMLDADSGTLQYLEPAFD
jgi:muramoyltetrapeptide carboxypeptidase